MECPVCYNTTHNILKCGHFLCRGCAQEWYLKSQENCNCPMCRKPIYYNGFRDMCEKLEIEKIENFYEEVFELVFEKMCDCLQESFDPRYIEVMKDVQKKLNIYKFSETELDYDDLIEFIMDDNWSYFVISEGPIEYKKVPPNVPKKKSHTVLKKVKHPLKNRLYGSLRSPTEPTLLPIECM